MEERCSRCKTRLFPSDKQVKCNNCGALYHSRCWVNYTEKCVVCGTDNDDFSDKRIQTYKKTIEEKAIQELSNEEKIALEEQIRQKAEQEKYQARINHLKATGRDGYYEYKVISIVDKKGAVDTEKLMNELNNLGLDGWRLQCAYTNEMGKDALSIAGFGINSTADQNILIFERFVKFE